MIDVDMFSSYKELYLYYCKLNKSLIKSKKSNVLNDIENKRIENEINYLKGIIIDINNYCIKTRKEWVNIILNLFNENDNKYYFQINKFEELNSKIIINSDKDIITTNETKNLKRLDTFIIDRQGYQIYSLDTILGNIENSVDENWNFDIDRYLNEYVKVELFAIDEKGLEFINNNKYMHIPGFVINKLKKYIFIEYKNNIKNKNVKIRKI